MLIRRIAVKDFRKLGNAVIEGLGDGLNVIVGDNEAGKSTLLAALRAGLFERHRVGGEVAAAMLPYGQAVRPEVSIEFEVAGQFWRLRKAFCQRPEAELLGPGERTVGDAVEDRLAELFGFTPPGRGGSKPEEHQGVHGLLWVEQGRSHRALGIGAGKDALASALEAEVGQLVGGERGRALLAAAEDRRAIFWDKRDKPRGSFKAAAELIETLEAQYALCNGELKSLNDKVTALAAKDEALSRHERDGRHAAAIRAQEAAREAVASAEGLSAAHATVKERAARLHLQHAAALERVSARTRLVADAKKAAEALSEAETALADERLGLARRDATAALAQTAAAHARALNRAAAETLRHLERAREMARTAAEISSLIERLEAADALDARMRAHGASVAGITLTADDLADLERLARDRDRAQAQRDVASVRLQFEPDAAQPVFVEGVAHPPAEPLVLARDVTVSLAGFGRLVVHPGGGIGPLADKAETAERRLADQLATLGYADVASARAALNAKIEATRDIARAREALALHAPRGLDALRLDLAERRAALGENVSPSPPSTAEIDAAVRLEAETASAADEAELASTEARLKREGADRRCTALAERSDGLRRDDAATSQSLALSRAERSDLDLADAVQGAARDFAMEEANRQRAADALAAADPEAVMLELKRAEGAERAIRSDLERLRREKRDLEVELRTLGEKGLGEALAETGERLDAARRAHAGLESQARAAKLLHQTLSEAQRETRDRWLGPVRERASPYLRLVQPDSEVVLDEATLEIEGLLRRGLREPFAGLSMGAREQVAVITRLALAEILRDAGRPSAIILDDALVNTDEERLRRMHLVLQRAGQTLQVIVLTCRERDFMDLGAPIHRM